MLLFVSCCWFLLVLLSLMLGLPHLPPLECALHFILFLTSGSFNKKIKITMGMSRKRHTGAFRTRLKDAVMADNAAGFGRALAAAGNPMGGGGGLQDLPVRP